MIKELCLDVFESFEKDQQEKLDLANAKLKIAKEELSVIFDRLKKGDIDDWYILEELEKVIKNLDTESVVTEKGD